MIFFFFLAFDAVVASIKAVCFAVRIEKVEEIVAFFNEKSSKISYNWLQVRNM